MSGVMRNVKNYAFIDTQNLYLGIKNQGWSVDFKKLRIYLSDKYSIGRAYLFMGYIESRAGLYEKLKRDGYVIVFKPAVRNEDGTFKGNCDAEMVLHAMIEYDNYDKALIVSGDGDFHCLAEYLKAQDKLAAVMVPDEARYSGLLKKLNDRERKLLVFLNRAKDKIEYLP